MAANKSVIKQHKSILTNCSGPNCADVYNQVRYEFIKDNEGYKPKVYDDTAKGHFKTIGIGFNMDADGARNDWNKSLSDVSFDDAYNGKISLNDEQIKRLFDYSIDIRQNQIINTYGQNIWNKLKPNEKLVIEDAYFNSPKLVDRSSNFYKHITKYAETGDKDYLKGAIFELEKRSNPYHENGIQNRRDAEAEMLKNDLLSYEDKDIQHLLKGMSKEEALLKSIAGYNSNLELAEKLIWNEANTDAVDRCGNNILKIFAERYNSNKVENIELFRTILASGADLFKFSDKSLIELSSPNYKAEFHQLIIQEYINRGYIDQAIDTKGNYLLHYAVMHKNYDLISKLTDQMSDTNVTNSQGDTPLNMVLDTRSFYSFNSQERNTIAEALLDSGMDPTILNKSGENALSKNYLDHYSALGSTLLKHLAELGNAESLNRADKYGSRPLDYAVKYKDAQLLNDLVQKGADVNAKDNDGNTFLHKAFTEPYNYKNDYVIKDYVDVAIKNGFNPFAPNNNGDTVFNYLNYTINYNYNKAYAMKDLLDYTKSIEGFDQNFPLDHEGHDAAYYEAKINSYIPDSTDDFEIASNTYDDYSANYNIEHNCIHIDEEICRIHCENNWVNP